MTACVAKLSRRHVFLTKTVFMMTELLYYIYDVYWFPVWIG